MPTRRRTLPVSLLACAASLVLARAVIAAEQPGAPTGTPPSPSHDAVTHPGPPGPAASPTAPDPAVIFTPFDAGNQPNVYRSAAGIPGPGYWQNRADYAIDATIDTGPHALHGTETITYTNNSPDALDVLWVQLDQNIYRRGRARQLRRALLLRGTRPTATRSRASASSRAAGRSPRRSWSATPACRSACPRRWRHGGAAASCASPGTTPCPAPGAAAPRSPRRQNGDIYEMAQWFPRMAVYDDLRGWDTGPYLGQEFYLEYGDIDYRVTVPWNFLVEGSGALLNPGEVLTATERARLAAAARSDRTVMIRAPAEVTDPATRPTRSGTLTWHFRMQTRATWRSPRRPHSPGTPPASTFRRWRRPRAPSPCRGWRCRSTPSRPHELGPLHRVREARDRVLLDRWYPFPWPNAVNLAGHGAGMEYPAMAFDGIADAGATCSGSPPTSSATAGSR